MHSPESEILMNELDTSVNQRKALGTRELPRGAFTQPHIQLDPPGSLFLIKPKRNTSCHRRRVYGWDKPDDSTLRLTLLHTPETAGGYSYQNRQDFGLHRFSYSFTGHPGQLDRAAVSEAAAAYNRPLKAFYTSKHAGMIGREFSFASSDNPSVMIKALKKAEVSDEYVIRLYETSGRGPQTAGITFAGRILSAVSADGTEKTAGKAEFSGNRLEVEVSPYGMATYKVRLEKKTPVERHFAYADLEYDRRCFSWNAFRNAADFLFFFFLIFSAYLPGIWQSAYLYLGHGKERSSRRALRAGKNYG